MNVTFQTHINNPDGNQSVWKIIKSFSISHIKTSQFHIYKICEYACFNKWKSDTSASLLESVCGDNISGTTNLKIACNRRIHVLLIMQLKLKLKSLSQSDQGLFLPTIRADEFKMHVTLSPGLSFYPLKF